MFFGIIGAAVGPVLAGWIFGVTGSYEYAFTGLAAMGVIGLALVNSLPRRRTVRTVRS